MDKLKSIAKKTWAKLKEWARKVKAGIQTACRKFAVWCLAHEEEVRKYIPMLVAGIALVGKELLRRSRENHEFRRKECWHYDRRTSEWVRSKRKLTAAEADFLEKRYREGYSKREVLDFMDLLR